MIALQVVVSMWFVAMGAPALLQDPQEVPVADLSTRFELVGKLKSPLGTFLNVAGVVVARPSKGYETGPNLRVQRLGEEMTQEHIQILLRPYPGKKDALPEFKRGTSYELEGYETGGYVGIPAAAYRKAGVPLQTPAHYFRTYFVVVSATEIEPISYKPSDFPGKRALLAGTARTENSRSMMTGAGWKVVVDPTSGWPPSVEGKTIETYGAYVAVGATPGSFLLVDGTWRLTQLEDQLGQQVELRGTARSRNGHWWFNYRGMDLYVEDMKNLPGWTSDNHRRAIVIMGTLEKARLPRIDQIGATSGPLTAEYFIVRNPSWSEASRPLLFPEIPDDGWILGRFP